MMISEIHKLQSYDIKQIKKSKINKINVETEIHH